MEVEQLSISLRLPELFAFGIVSTLLDLVQDTHLTFIYCGGGLSGIFLFLIFILIAGFLAHFLWFILFVALLLFFNIMLILVPLPVIGDNGKVVDI